MPITHIVSRHDREDGFTLVELLIVVLIIGILAAIAIPIYLGVQANGYKSAVRADVNISVKRVQVAITEGIAMADIRTGQVNYTQRSVPGEVVSITTSTTSGASTNDYGIQGSLSTTSTPAGPINYTYTYDSVTGKFTESDTTILGAGKPITLTTTGLPDGKINTAYNTTISSIVANPNGPTTYTATGLPSGLTIDTATGKITGTTATTGTYGVTITAINGSVSDGKTYNLNINSSPVITTDTVAAATQNMAYSQTLTASGTPTPTWAVTNGTLPNGITLTTNGLLGGKATVTGSYDFSVTATNAGGGTTKAYTLAVNAAPGIITTTLADATVGSTYTQAVTATGYPTPTYSATGLPSGLSMDSTTGTITGTPNGSAGANTASVKITATNPLGSDNTTLPLLVNAIAPTITTATLADGKVGNTYSQTLAATNASGNITWTITSGTLQSGLSLNATTGVISGTPVSGSYGTVTLNITATAAGKTSTAKTLFLRVSEDIALTNANAELGAPGGGGWGSYWSNTSGFSNTVAHTGSWSYYGQHISSGGPIQGVQYCYSGSYKVNVKVQINAYIAGTNGVTWTAYSRANNWEGWGVDAGSGGGATTTTGTGAADWKAINITYTPDGNSGPLCIGAKENYHAGDTVYMDDVTLTLG